MRVFRPNGSVAWTRQFGSNQTDLAVGAAVDPSASLVVSGTSTGALPGQVSKGGADAFVRKYDPDGNVIELKAYRDAAVALEIAPESETP